jgi:hypothetical protein
MSFCDPPDAKKKKSRRKRQYPKSSGRNAGHRVRSLPKELMIPVNQTVFQPGDGAFPDPITLMPIPEKQSTMYDTHGFIQNWYNPVCHERYDGVYYPIPEISDSDGPIVSFGSSPGFVQMFRDTLPFLTASELDELALQSEEKLSNVVSAEVDLFNFLRELIEFCSGNIRLIRRFSDLYTRMVKAFQDAYKRLISQGHKEAAAYWLAWNFAIKPFLKDLRSILCSVSALHKKLDWLRRNNHKVIFQTFRREFDLPVDPNLWHNGWILCVIDKADPPISANGTYMQQLKYHSVKLEYVARAKILLSIPDHLLDDAHGGVGALWAAYNGLTNPVAVIWEAIPFSWLVDYFLSFRARLFQRMYDFNPFNEGVNVLGFGHSFRWAAIAVGRISRNTPDSAEWCSAGRVDYTLYRREAGLPYPGQISYFRVPSDWYRLSIIGAVGIGRLPKRRRR